MERIGGFKNMFLSIHNYDTTGKTRHHIYLNLDHICYIPQKSSSSRIYELRISSGELIRVNEDDYRSILDSLSFFEK